MSYLSYRKTFIIFIISIFIISMLILRFDFLYQKYKKSKNFITRPIVTEVEGEVIGLPDYHLSNLTGRSVEHFYLKTKDGVLRLNWYNSPKSIGGNSDSIFHSGNRLKLWVKLKPLHALTNPGLANHVLLWRLQGIIAGGYVLSKKPTYNAVVAKKVGARHLSKYTHSYHNAVARQSPSSQIQSSHNAVARQPPASNSGSIREQIKQKIINLSNKSNLEPNSNLNFTRFILALSIGDTAKITNSDREILQKNGVSHLLAISGMHIGLVALLVGGFFRIIFACTSLAIRYPSQKVGWAFAIFAAILYGYISGWSVSSIRSVIMLIVFGGSVILSLRSNLLDRLFIAFLLVIFILPESVLMPGFWLSFGAVFILCTKFSPFGFAYADNIRDGVNILKTFHFLGRMSVWNKCCMGIALPFLGRMSDWRRFCRWGSFPFGGRLGWGGPSGKIFYLILKKSIYYTSQLAQMQLKLMLGLFPITLYFFGQYTFISIISNLVAVPLVSFIVLPLILIGVCFLFILPNFAYNLLFLADNLFGFLWKILINLSQLSKFSLFGFIAKPSFLFMLIGILGVILIFRKNDFKFKILGVILIITMLCYKPLALAIPYGKVKMQVLDVGQGLSVVIFTQNHVLVYDTGAHFLDGFDAGFSVLVPYLRAMGVGKIDWVVISHGDNDHIGGFSSLNKYFNPHKIYTSFDKLIKNNKYAAKCEDGYSWSADGVNFKIMQANKIEFKSRSKSKSKHKSRIKYIVKANQNTDRSHCEASLKQSLAQCKAQSTYRFAKSYKSKPKPKISRNNRSCVLKITDKSHKSILLTGDIEKPAEDSLISQYGKELKADVLVAPHHGSKTSSSYDWIKEVSPKLVIFATGFFNKFGFPHQVVIDRYKSIGSKLNDVGVLGGFTFKT